MIECCLLTCILPPGTAGPVLEKLSAEKGLHTAYLHRARGQTAIGHKARKGIAAWLEREIVSVVVPAKDADELFNYIYFTASLDKPHGGLIYMEKWQSIPESCLSAAGGENLPDKAAAPDTAQ